MRLASWNINNRVGKTTFKPEAAIAACTLGVDLFALTEYFPGAQEAVFRETLAEHGYMHQLTTPPNSSERANRVLIASRRPIAPHALTVPLIDVHLPSNILAVKVPGIDLLIVALRMPWYNATDPRLMQAWNWLSSFAMEQKSHRVVMMGDFNVSSRSRAPRGGNHFRAMLANGWHRANTGTTFPGANGVGSEIDHILGTEHCILDRASVISEVAGFSLAGSADALSDHAAIACTVSVK